MRKKTKSPGAVSSGLKSTPTPPPPQPPPWYLGYFEHIQTHRSHIHELAGSSWTLPPFQRGEVWDVERQAAFANSVFSGLPTGPILAWERSRRVNDDRSEVTRFLLDGQQRLTALGVPIVRADGTANRIPCLDFDIKTGRFVSSPAPGVTPARLVDFETVWGRKDELPEPEFWGLCYAQAQLQRAELVVYDLSPYTSPARAVEAFRCINRPGIAFDEAEIEKLIASIDSTWDGGAQ